MQKARREAGLFLFSHELAASALLDRGQNPLAAAAAQEGPDFGDLLRLFRTLDNAAARALAHQVDERVSHRDARIIAAVLVPGFREVALQELDVAHFVDHAAAG